MGGTNSTKKKKVQNAKHEKKNFCKVAFPVLIVIEIVGRCFEIN